MYDRIFVDSNVWVYLFASDDSSKRSISECFISENLRNTTFVVSWQVMNEVANVLKRKGFNESNIRFVTNSMLKICIVHDFSENILLSASLLREKHSFSFWDSLIIASAVDAQCEMVVSEDMQDNQKIKGLQIRNIFR
ncbi:twitching motility protein PilT [Bacteroidia bacterium]|nr:twitching motility protein PilT [Bacteroidia bacterium]